MAKSTITSLERKLSSVIVLQMDKSMFPNEFSLQTWWFFTQKCSPSRLCSSVCEENAPNPVINKSGKTVKKRFRESTRPVWILWTIPHDPCGSKKPSDHVFFIPHDPCGFLKEIHTTRVKVLWSLQARFPNFFVPRPFAPKFGPVLPFHPPWESPSSKVPETHHNMCE